MLNVKNKSQTMYGHTCIFMVYIPNVRVGKIVLAIAYTKMESTPSYE